MIISIIIIITWNIDWKICKSLHYRCGDLGSEMFSNFLKVIQIGRWLFIPQPIALVCDKRMPALKLINNIEFRAFASQVVAEFLTFSPKDSVNIIRN